MATGYAIRKERLDTRLTREEKRVSKRLPIFEVPLRRILCEWP
jgi:hypothetical protein